MPCHLRRIRFAAIVAFPAYHHRHIGSLLWYCVALPPIDANNARSNCKTAHLLACKTLSPAACGPLRLASVAQHSCIFFSSFRLRPGATAPAAQRHARLRSAINCPLAVRSNSLDFVCCSLPLLLIRRTCRINLAGFIVYPSRKCTRATAAHEYRG